MEENTNRTMYFGRLKLTRLCSDLATFNTRNSRNVDIQRKNVIDRKNIIDDHSSFTTFTCPNSASFVHYPTSLWLFCFLFIHLFISTFASSNHRLAFISSNYQLPGLQVASSTKLSSSNNIKFDFLTQDSSGLNSVSSSRVNGLTNNLLAGYTNSPSSSSSAFDRIGPQFIIEPLSNAHIPNTSGLTIQCEASGQPSVKINWLKADNTELEPVGKLRKIGADGSLIFSKFSSSEFRPDVHNAAYKCVASNSVGRIVSRTVRVKANIQQPYEIQVYDDFVMRGNIGVLRCQIPAFVRDYVQFVSWLRNDGLVLSPDQQDNRYMVFPTGELHIGHVDQIDSQLQYRCQTRNKMTGELKQSSNAGRLIITDPHSNVPPKITDRKPFIIADKSDQVLIPCASQGSPVPQTVFFQILAQHNLSSTSQSTTSFQDNRIKVGIDGSKERIYQWNTNLVIRDASLEDSGKYLCVVSNSAGEDSMETDLLVREPLSTRIEPRLFVSQENDQNVVINCTVQGYPIRKVLWFKNGQAISNSEPRIRPFVDRLLFKQIKRDDRGVYQCIAVNEFDSSTSSVELALSDEPARLIETFSSDSLLLKTGDKLSLKCVASGNPLPQITWTLDGQPIAEQHRLRVGDYVNADGFVNSFVNISSLRVEDGGYYECSAINLLPTKPYVHLWPFEYTALEQQKHISSSPIDFNLPIYNQQSSNDVIARHRARVNVIGPPNVRKIMNNITVVSGDSLYITCPVYGYPIKEIRWYKGNIKLPENHRQHVYQNGTLIIHQMEKANDESEYRCVVYGASSVTNHYETVLLSPNDQLHNQHFDYHKLTASGTFYVRVIVAPLISPFSAPQILREGMRNMLTCSVLEGDPPFQIRWLKTVDGPEGISHHLIPIESSTVNSPYQTKPTTSRLKVTSNDEFSSTLFFTNVSYEDNGNYTCIISNTVASANHTVNMMVKVPPKWVHQPQDTEAVVGQDLLLHCQANGHPATRIWWEFQSANSQLLKSSINSANYISSSSDKNQSPVHTSKATYQNVISNSHIHTLENGTLIIREVSKADEGNYLCQATNGVNSGISKVISLNVHVPAHFKNSFSAETIRKGDDVRIVCEAFGEEPITLSWSKDRIPFQPAKEPRYSLSERTSGEQKSNNANSRSLVPGDQKTSKDDIRSASIRVNSLNRLNALQDQHSHSYINILEINQTDRRDSALFTCVCSNLYGKDEYNVQIIVQEPPDKPENVQTSQINSRSAMITWTVPYSGNSLIISYQAQVKKAKEVWSDTSENHQIESSNGNVNVLTLRKLKPVTSYEVRIRCENALGWSEYSDVLQFVTKEEAPNSPPSLPVVYALNSRQLQVTFKPSKQEDSDTVTVIKGYYIGYRLVALTNGQSNQANAGPTKQPQEQVYIFKTVTLNELSNDNSEKPFEVKLTDLRKASKYGIIVQAFNNKGSGPASEEVFGETLSNDPPSSPILSIATVTHSSVKLSWTFANSEFNEQLRKAIELEQQTNLDSGNSEEGVEPISQQKQQINQSNLLVIRPTNVEIGTNKPNRESLVSGYYLHYKSHKSNWEEKQLPGNLNSFTFGNLLCGQYYQFYVIAYNNVDKSEPSQVVSTRTKGSEPKPPSVKEFIQCNSTMAILQMKQWKTNGCEIHSFTVQYRTLRKPQILTKQTDPLKDGQVRANRRIDNSGQQSAIDDWILISNNILADERNVEIYELQPGNWYSLLIGAQTDMGLLEKEYTFSTLTLDGATIAPFEATELGQNRLKYAPYNLVFPSVCAFLVLLFIIVVGFLTIWRKDIQMNRANTAQLNSVAGLTQHQHLNAMSTYATPSTTLHHQSTTTGSSGNQCAHFDEFREHSCISGEELLTDACFQLSSTNTVGLTGCGNSNCNNNCNNYTLNTFAPIYGQSTLNHDPNSTDQFKDLTNNALNTLNHQTINNAMSKDCHQDCHQDCHLMPTPYASNQLTDYDRVLKQNASLTNQLASNLANNSICTQHTYSVTPIATGTLNQQTTNQMPATNFPFDRYNNCPTGTGNSEHTYDIPIPPKWV